MLAFPIAVQLSIDIAILGVIYTLLGLCISLILHYLFDEFNDAWKAKSTAFHIFDIVVELIIVILASFWLGRLFRNAPTFFVAKASGAEIGTHAFDVFFMLALFVFLDELIEKMRYLKLQLLTDQFDAIFPRYGSILDLSLSYTPPKNTTIDQKDVTE